MDYARRAVEIGLTEIGFSDHSPMRQDNFDNWRMNFSQLDEYVEKVRRAQKEFPQLTIRLALEVDYLPGQRRLDPRTGRAASVGLFHRLGALRFRFVGRLTIPHKLSEWKNRDSFEVWQIYFERLTMAAESKLFEIIGHADLPKKFGHPPDADCTPLYEKFLDAAKKSGCAIELNTAGLRKDCKEIYPSREILRSSRFKKACRSRLVRTRTRRAKSGMNFAEAVQLAREVGYTRILPVHRTQTQTGEILIVLFKR